MVQEKLTDFVENSGVKTRDVPAMCGQDYVRNPEDTYGDPWKFREQLYAQFEFDPTPQAKWKEFAEKME